MIRVATQVIRVIIPVILFQFIAPAFLPGQEVRDRKIVCYEPIHGSIISPAFLKEIEPEAAREFTGDKAVTLLDFACHFDYLNSLLKRPALWDDLVFNDHAVLYFTLYRTFRI
jgi:hypothetical protein